MSAQVIQPGTQEHKHVIESFGLTSNICQDIGARIFGGYNGATPNDVRTAAGTYAYFSAIRALRDILCPLGWQLHREGNVEMVLAASSQFAITASTGDENTGIDNKAEPKTKNSKGSQTGKLVSQNQNQTCFPGMESSQPIYDPDKIPTWILLYHVDLDKNETRMELSLPINIDINTMRINGWKERIILSEVKFDGTPINSDNQTEIYSDFDIEIKRKINE
jgi:hypothetical protein